VELRPTDGVPELLCPGELVGEVEAVPFPAAKVSLVIGIQLPSGT
jgi:hypothetical protein